MDLGAQRRPIDKNDLPQTLKVLETFRVSILDGKTASFAPEADSALLVPISSLAENDYNLSAERYRKITNNGKQKYPRVPIIDVCELFIDGNWIESKDQSDSGIRLVQTGNVGFGEYIDKTERSRFISEEKFLDLIVLRFSQEMF